MDLALYSRVIWRFRYLVFLGVLLALALAFFSYAKVSSAGVTYRGSETWEASETLLITERGFPIGRSGSPTVVIPAPATDGSATSTVPATTTTIPSSPTDALRFAAVAPIYAELANGDEVAGLARRAGPLPGSFSAAPAALRRVGAPRQQLPFITITSAATTPTDAVTVAQRASAAFVAFVERRQSAAGIAKHNRTVLQVVSEAKKPVKVSGRKLTIPIVILLTVLIATLAFAFILENLRPRSAPHPVATEQQRDDVRVASRAG